MVDTNDPGGSRWTLETGDNAVTTQVGARILVNSARAGRIAWGRHEKSQSKAWR